MSNGVKKKKKTDFQDFRNNEKFAYKTFKIPLKTILQNCDTTQPLINHLVFEMNDLMIHSYQFIRLYVLNCYTNNNTKFVCIILEHGINQRKYFRSFKKRRRSRF